MLDNFGVDTDGLRAINAIISDDKHPLMMDVLKVIEKYGSITQINAKAKNAAKLTNLLRRLEASKSPFRKDIQWLLTQRDQKRFISVSEYRQKILKKNYDSIHFDSNKSVTLEISPLQYFPWLMQEARQALANGEIMPGRFIRLRKMKEQEADGELLAVTAALKILGSSCVESPETTGADGSNIHLGGPQTISGYYGGIGAPNDYPVKWLDEILYYYTHYGIDEFINVNNGTMIAALLAHRLGIDIGVKISVTMGHDNLYHMFWTMMTAKLFQRHDGSTALVGLNFSNSVNNDTILQSARLRSEMGFEQRIRFEHHITEPFLGVVRQPYLRREQLLELAPSVANISAKHEGGEPDVEAGRDHPSNHADNFRTRAEVMASGEMEMMQRNYMDKHDALNKTARALTRSGLGFIGAVNLHHGSS